MKKLITLSLITMIFLMSGCSSKPQESKEETTDTQTPAQSETVNTENTDDVTSEKKILVAYFSATGNTKGVAEKIAKVTGADLYEIVPAEPYTSEDLNYNNSASRSTSEQNDKNARPAIGSEDVAMEEYSTVYLGFPIWWGEEPRILDSFVEKYSFEGITLIPFCTSGGSGIGRSGPNMEELAGSGKWLEGKRFNSNVSEDDLKSWIKSLN